MEVVVYITIEFFHYMENDIFFSVFQLELLFLQNQFLDYGITRYNKKVI